MLYISLALIFFVASLIQAVIGFGFALTAVPFLAFLAPVREAVPLIVLLGISSNIGVLSLVRKHLEPRRLFPLFAGAVLGIPIGAFFLKHGDPDTIKVILGTLIMMYALWALTQPKEAMRIPAYSAYVFGFISGVMGGAYTLTGPAVIIYIAFQEWEPNSIRALLQAYFLPTGLLTLAFHVLNGLVTPAILLRYIIMLPAVLIGVFVGHRIASRIHREKFAKYVLLMLVATGFLMVVNICFL